MTVERRTLIKGAAASAALVLVGGAPLRADNHNGWQGWRDQLLAGRELSEGTITLDLPAVAENGAQVPLTVQIDSPMTADDHVSAIHIIATRNPAPQIGTFRLTPQMTRAEVMTRIRVAEEQEILVLAELSDGRVFQQTASIIVSVGGCAT
ncbi:thiosulfate oxidation carrier protein SoxY [Yoonia vestfoldensis]|uniref:thiosulfate oxidation carrier protein SoxY n=1 Tax=Yoonia vestfoldensis TaxID=245188 RepID=UPI000374F16F|nr:thiosulfate oxidation carrier protein SoxY [Yoonia vestfoldensis]